MSSFRQRILEKLRHRVDNGSICLVVRANDFYQMKNLRYHMYFGNLIGTIELSPNDFANTQMEFEGSNRKLYVADLAIREDCRRRGIATQLLLEIENFARTNLYDEIYLHVEVNNVIARNLYLKLGYKEVTMNENVVAFTETRLQKPADFFVLLWKQIIAS